MAPSQPHHNDAAPVVSFDLDGVIMRGPFVTSVRPRIWEHLSRGSRLAHLAAEERERHIWQAVRGEHDRRLSENDHVGAWNWQSIYDEVNRGIGGEPVPDLATIVRESCAVDPAVMLLPGAGSGLQRLADAGVRIVAITNGYYAFQWPVLEALGVAGLFEAVITPDVAGFAKPDPRIFGLVPGLIAHVGDLLLHDVLGANLAGIQSIWLDPELPQAFQAAPPGERTRLAGFEEYVTATLENSRYRRFHPQATPQSCMPMAVVRDVDEAATVLLDSIAAWTPASD
jgi:putative hydrolase of the HAD superfamily